MSDGARTRDISDHNRVLYQLSYTHHASAGPDHHRDADADTIVPGRRGCPGPDIAHSSVDGSGWSGTPAPDACSNAAAIDLAVAESGPDGGTNTACR